MYTHTHTHVRIINMLRITNVMIIFLNDGSAVQCFLRQGIWKLKIFMFLLLLFIKHYIIWSCLVLSKWSKHNISYVMMHLLYRSWQWLLYRRRLCNQPFQMCTHCFNGLSGTGFYSKVNGPTYCNFLGLLPFRKNGFLAALSLTKPLCRK